jgi:hypothetical protein
MLTGNKFKCICPERQQDGSWKEANYLEVGPIIHCSTCKKDIKREEFIEHYNAHAEVEQNYHSAGAGWGSSMDKP